MRRLRLGLNNGVLYFVRCLYLADQHLLLGFDKEIRLIFVAARIGDLEHAWAGLQPDLHLRRVLVDQDREPTLVVGLDNSARVAREEIFGPVLVAIPHDGDDDAVRIANDSPYGLSGSISSGDSERAWAVARRIRTGTLGINGGVWYSGDVPFGGYKQSGIGREMGVAGFEEYLETKTTAEPA